MHYFAGDGPRPVRSEETLRAALAAIGSSSDIDREEWMEELDRIRHESKPTPPLDVDDLFDDIDEMIEYLLDTTPLT